MDFEKQYTDDDYANKACEANATGQILYVLVTEDESDGAKKKVGNLVLAEPGYYVCYEANYTDGTINENLEAEKAQKERERIAMLSLTAADVERAIYKVRGMDFDDVIALVEQYNENLPSPLAGEGQGEGSNFDIKALKIELKANNFYRGNPYIEKVGQLLGFTSEKLDKFFETKDAEELR